MLIKSISYLTIIFAINTDQAFSSNYFEEEMTTRKIYSLGEDEEELLTSKFTIDFTNVIARQQRETPENCFARGVECAKRFQTPAAMTWYLKAAAKNHADAQFNIGVLILQKWHGVEQNREKAFEWFAKAAEEVKYADFTRYNLTDDEAPRLTSILAQAKSLRALNLSENQLTSKGSKHILRALQKCPTLRTLNVNYNRIDDEEGGKALKLFVNKHAPIEISFEGIRISDKMSGEVYELMITMGLPSLLSPHF